MRAVSTKIHGLIPSPYRFCRPIWGPRRFHDCYPWHRGERIYGCQSVSLDSRWTFKRSASTHSQPLCFLVEPTSHLLQGIGILARLLVEFEANPIEPHFERGTPVYSTVQCAAEHAKDFPAHLRALVKASVNSDRALRKLEATLINDPFYRALIGTTQAIDLVQGGVKTNALPEEAWAVVNHRIATQRSGFPSFFFVSRATYPEFVSSAVAALKERDASLLKHLANEFNLTYTAFGSAITKEDGPSAGTLTLTDAWGTALEPAPITPTGEDSAPWQLLSGTIKATYNAHRDLEGRDNVFVSPGIMTGNTGGCTGSCQVRL